MSEHLPDVKEVREAALEHRLLSDEQEARAEEIAHKLRFAWAQRKGGRLIVDLRDRVAELERHLNKAEIERAWAIGKLRGAMPDGDDRPVEVWRGERKVTVYGDSVLRIWGANIETEMFDEPRSHKSVGAAFDWLYGTTETTGEWVATTADDRVDADRWRAYLKHYDREEMVAAEWDGPAAITAFIDGMRASLSETTEGGPT